MTSVKPAVDEAARTAQEAHFHAEVAAEGQIARERGEDERALRDNVFRFFEIQTFVLREKISLLSVLNVFFLLNVDSYTRDDLMSMVAVKLACSVLHSKLVLEEQATESLAILFQSMRISKELLMELGDASKPIYPCLRTGQWIQSDAAYSHFLAQARSNPSKNAEPLDRIVKNMTITQMNRSRVEESVRLLWILLDAPAGSEPGKSARQAFLQGVLELVNACFRSVYAENLSSEFLDGLRPTQTENLKQMKEKQTEAMRKLVPMLSEQQLRSYHDAEIETTRWAQESTQGASDDLLFERLRVLCILQLQLVSVSAYTMTGEALKVSSMLAAHGLDRKQLPVYWLVCFFEGMSSLGYTSNLLLQVLSLWKTNPRFLFSGSSAATLPGAKAVFSELTGLFKDIRGSDATPCYINFFTSANATNNIFRVAFADFLKGFVLQTRDREVVKTKEGTIELTDRRPVVTQRLLRACEERKAVASPHDDSRGILLLRAVSADWATGPHSDSSHMSSEEVTATVLKVHSFFSQV